jgi:hypothetical protein
MSTTSVPSVLIILVYDTRHTQDALVCGHILVEDHVDQRGSECKV